MRKYAYCRVSTDEQGASGIGLEHQRRMSLKIGSRFEELWGSERFPDVCSETGFFVDEISAYRVPFAKRPAGKALLEVLDPGDILIISRLDRGFRSVADFSNFIKLAQKNDWNIVVGEPQIDLTTPIGRMMAKMYVLLSEWYSDFNGTRVSEALATKNNSKPLRAEASRKFDVVPSAESEYRPPSRMVLPADLPKVMRSGRVFVYVRCSHRTSAQSGLGLRHQMTKCCEYADMLAENQPNLEWKEVVYVDPAVSALSVGFTKRPQGSKLDKELRDGDVVVCLRPDRIFGSINNMSETLVDWKKRGVDLHFVDGGFSMDTASGQMFLNVMVSFSQFERQLASSRAKETYAVMASQGRFTGGRCGFYPPFYREHIIADRSTGEKKRRLIIDHKQMVAFRYLLIMSNRMSQTEAVKRLEEIIAKRENRRPIPLSGVKRRGPWKNIPAYYVPNRTGYVFPIWTTSKFRKGLKLWDEVQGKWREKMDEEREILRALADKSGFRPHLPQARKPSQRFWGNKTEDVPTANLP